jgi:hypothetical protein
MSDQSEPLNVRLHQFLNGSATCEQLRHAAGQVIARTNFGAEFELASRITTAIHDHGHDEARLKDLLRSLGSGSGG